MAFRPLYKTTNSMPDKEIKSAIPEDPRTAAWFFPMLKTVEAVFQAAFGSTHHAELLLTPEGTPTDRWVLRWDNYELLLQPCSGEAVAGGLYLHGKNIKRVDHIYDPAALCDLVLELAIDLIRKASQQAYRNFERTQYSK